MNTNIPLSARGVEIQNPLDQYGKVLSLQQMIQQKQLGDQQLNELVRKQKYEVEKRDAFKAAHDEVTQYMQNTLSKERFQLGAPPDGNQADMNAPAVPTIAPQVIANDPRYHYLMAQKLQSGGYLEDAKLAMEYGQKLEKDNAPKSEIGKLMEDLEKLPPGNKQLAQRKLWRELNGPPPEGFDYHPETGERVPAKDVQAFILQKRKEGATKVNQFNNTKDDFKNERDLRNDFKSEPIYKAHAEVRSAHSQIKAGISQKSPAGDLAAATKFMKILDPTSVVRESELNMALQASGILDRAMNFLPRIINGTKLTEDQREDFGKLADEFYRLSEQAYQAKAKEYKGIAKDYGLNENRVGGSGGWTIEEVK